MNLKFRTCLLLIFIANDCYAQFADDFSDGNFNQDPVWSETHQVQHQKQHAAGRATK